MNALAPISTFYEELYGDAWKALCRKEGHMKSLPAMVRKIDLTTRKQSRKRETHLAVAGDWFAGRETGTARELADYMEITTDNARHHIRSLSKRGSIKPTIKRGKNEAQIYRATDKLVAEVAARS